MNIEPLERSDITFFAGLSSLLYSILDRFHIVLPLCIAFSLAFFVIGLVFVHSYRVYRLDDKRFEMLEDFDATAHLNNVNNAKKLILITHFTERIPSPRYLRALLNRLDDGVQIVRIIPDGLDLSQPNFQWLRDFQGKQGYSEEVVRVRLPFDVFVFDREIVTITLPEDTSHRQFIRGIRLKNKEVALWFRNMIENLRKI
ncbi:MAG: hypothetical protein ACKO25_09910 [Cyanobium sp.]